MKVQADIDVTINQLMAGSHSFKSSTPLWDSRFGDDEWFEETTGQYLNWKDLVFGRGTGRKHPNAIKSRRYAYCLTPSMVEDLKVAAAIHALYPSMLANARSNKRSTALSTVSGRIQEVAKLFSIIIIKRNSLGGKRFKKLSDFTIDDLKYGIHAFTGRPEALKRGLKLISHQNVQKNFSSPLQWTLLDITKSTFDWGKSPDSEQISTLADAQFLMLLEHSRRSVAEFMTGMKFQRAEQEICPKSYPTKFDPECFSAEVLSAFLCGDVSSDEAAERTGIHRRRFSAALNDVHNSAMMIVLLLTGMRVSEVGYLLSGCLEEKYGYWFLKSKVVKGKSRSVPPVEGWLAVPLVRDAYAVLSYLCGRVGGIHLFSSIHRSYKKDEKELFAPGALNTKFNRWIARIDTEQIFKDHHFSVHQCRETLVAQLAAQDVGLAFISMQLRHVHGQLNNMPNLVTASYGQYRSQLLTSVSNMLAVAREDALLQVYGEGARLAGPGSTSHKVRIDSFFAGLGLFGEDRVKYVKEMARKGVRLMPTSIGSCTKSFISPDGGKMPPCAGDYNCDPNCESHVVTERGVQVIQARKTHAERALEDESIEAYKLVWTNLIAKFDILIGEMAKKKEI